MTETTSAGWPVKAPPRATSLFVSGLFPRRRALVVVLGLLGGVLLAYLWPVRPADDGSALSAAARLLGREPGSAPPQGVAAGALFALVSGLAGSFTAGGLAAFGVVGPLIGRMSLTRRPRSAHALHPLAWLAAGMLPVAVGYGALAGLFGARLPQFAAADASGGVSPGPVQAMAVYGAAGLVMLAIGLAAAGALPDPLERVARRFPNAPLVLVGAVLGALPAGRPHPLFRQAALERRPLYGAAAFAFQSAGGLLVMAVLFVLLSGVLGTPVQRWLASGPARGAALTACAFLVAGAFTAVFWDLRLLGDLGVLRWPAAPWNG
ncbi:hypothetical protein [Kitasatospora sp. NPDC008115]|uniref:hypothetical protein n=1 Tax=Kitasatospora sp. NPDC008115 TaxID=3364022 RepID=UPI0036E08A3F